MFCYEIIPAYIAPILNGFNIICLATQNAPAGAQDVITNFFGGADSNEGLGFASISLDWQYVSSRSMNLPLIQQGLSSIFSNRSRCSHDPEANSWVGYFFCYIAIMGIYYSNAWNVSCISMSGVA